MSERSPSAAKERAAAVRKWPHLWRGRLRWRVRGFDYLCPECWRYSADDIPWCGHHPCSEPRFRNPIRKWRSRRGR